MIFRRPPIQAQVTPLIVNEQDMLCKALKRYWTLAFIFMAAVYISFNVGQTVYLQLKVLQKWKRSCRKWWKKTCQK